MIEVYRKNQQSFGEFNSGEIIENKPIGFPHESGGSKAYSNIFYWAFAEGKKDSTIGLHPHKGFEIMTYVIEGSIKHYDTLIKKWITLNKGDVQIIQSGSGISHSEYLEENSSIFQIWFDPNLEKSLYQKPLYKDYQSTNFKINNKKKIIIGENSPIKIFSEKINIYELFDNKDFIIENSNNLFLSIYILRGEIKIDKKIIQKDSFIKIKEEKEIKINVISDCKLFCISSPINPTHKTYI